MDPDTVPGIDPTAVGRWLDHLEIDRSGPLHFDRIGLGQSNLTYLVRDSADHRWVVRRPPLGHLLASAHDVGREARILSALTDTPVPTPRVLGYTDDPAFTEVPMVLMEFVDGRVVDTMEVAESLSPSIRERIGHSMAATLAKIHAVDIETVGLGDLASHKPYAQRQLKRWSRQWEQSKTADRPELDDLTRRLTAAVPEQQELTLVHGDFHLRNIITAPEGGEVTAVLDWELSTLGDPLADLGSLLTYWVHPGEDFAGDFTATALPGFPDRAQLADIYLAETGRDPTALSYWHALGLWKLAIIADGVLRRGMDDPRNKASAGVPTVERIDGIVRQARIVADEAGI
ncbi:phosphotransferase family protein [Nocardia cyriacigeorgica]|uniref:Phosphotransferase family protein n=2 Tax=Nocardia cyriacigeorgica TaxID=135487 RepID=A0A6P1DI66_9NOCA|nr:phosphotransferase family protein [Nocardia cyriacigeorgica]NEW42606.1 phosphotransferase family protein [Nocardia cyriacigeorgica]NEW48253.1 phosphotransferase family protein [Nocardia cyriacigeorgica]NEW53711.1 phosphotransferase family protein [Nocardia cyriacigeorgica]NEW58811.1 phosphotransferase family protein [Nocardia cyriacigeorgica]